MSSEPLFFLGPQPPLLTDGRTKRTLKGTWLAAPTMAMRAVEGLLKCLQIILEGQVRRGFSSTLLEGKEHVRFVSPVSSERPSQQGPRETLAKKTTAENISKGRSLGTLSVSENKTYLSCSSPSAQGADYSLGMINPQQFPAERGKAESVSTRRRVFGESKTLGDKISQPSVCQCVILSLGCKKGLQQPCW